MNIKISGKGVLPAKSFTKRFLVYMTGNLCEQAIYHYKRVTVPAVPSTFTLSPVLRTPEAH